MSFGSMSQNPMLFYLLIGVIILAALAAKLYALLQRHRLKNVADAFPGQIISGLFRTYFLGTWENRQFMLRATYGPRSFPPVLRIVMLTPCRFRLNMRLESFSDGIFKSIGLNREVQTGDNAFDGMFFLQSDDAAAVQSLFSSKEAKEAARSLSMNGFQLRFDQEGITAVKVNYNPALDPVLIKLLLEQMDVLAKSLPA